MRPSRTREDLYVLVRGQIDQEANLVSYRLSWLVGAEAFLFGAYASTVSKGAPAGQATTLVQVLRLTGIGMSLGIWLSILAAIAATTRLRQFYANESPRLTAEGPLPELVGCVSTHWLGFLPAIGLPPAIAAAWGWIWVFS